MTKELFLWHALPEPCNNRGSLFLFLLKAVRSLRFSQWLGCTRRAACQTSEARPRNTRAPLSLSLPTPLLLCSPLLLPTPPPRLSLYLSFLSQSPLSSAIILWGSHVQLFLLHPLYELGPPITAWSISEWAVTWVRLLPSAPLTRCWVDEKHTVPQNSTPTADFWAKEMLPLF